VCPADFVRLRTVCKQWNTILGELFFGTLVVNKEKLLEVVNMLQCTFEYKLPLLITRNTLTVSAETKHNDCAVHIDIPVETTGVEGKNLYFFLVETKPFYAHLSLCKLKYIPFSFSEWKGTITCSLGKDWSLFSTMWRPTCIPDHNFELRTNAGMFLSISNQSIFEYPDTTITMSIYSIHNERGGNLLLVSMSLDNRYEFEPAIRFDYYFMKENDQKVTRWNLLSLCDLISNEDAIGQRFIVKKEDLLFRKQYNRESIVDALRMLNTTDRLTVGISQTLVIKYSVGGSFDIQWVIQHVK
jgi:hypothetical protein